MDRLYFEPGLLREVAAANYDLITGPSYSAWEPRPRPEYLFNAKRSLVVFAALQELEAPAVPHLSWIIAHDVQRWAAWLELNRQVEMVAVDWMTYRSRRAWARRINGLRTLDALTGERLTFLINGVTREDRFRDLLAILPPKRLRLTNARAVGPPPTEEEKKRFAGIRGDKQGLRFGPRVAEERAKLSRAQAATGYRPARAAPRARLRRRETTKREVPRDRASGA